MICKYNKKMVPIARVLRKHMTPEEKHLWYDFLKLLPITVNRQKNIGNFIVDFFIAEKRIVIEIDGIQHHWEENAEQDRMRDDILRDQGFCVLRYSNMDIDHRFSSVCEDILRALDLPVSCLKK